MNISGKSLQILQSHGWTPERDVDAEPFASILQSFGYSMFPQAEKFYRSFGGLKGKSRDYSFDFTLKEITLAARYQTSRPAGEKTEWVPLGITNKGYQTVWLHKNGTVVSAFDGDETRYSSVHEFLLRLW